MINIIIRKVKTFFRDPKRAIDGKLAGAMRRAARSYVDDCGLRHMLVTNDKLELPPQDFDLANLHRLIRRYRPNTVLEFGSGFSTIAIAHALMMNGGGRLYSLEASQRWADNTLEKMPEELRAYVTLLVSTPRAILFNGQFSHVFDRIPNITPEFIYLDGPSPRDVVGEVHGLSFPQGDTEVDPDFGTG